LYQETRTLSGGEWGDVSGGRALYIVKKAGKPSRGLSKDPGNKIATIITYVRFLLPKREESTVSRGSIGVFS